MLAFTPSTIPRIVESVDFLNIMTYDLMNRRDNVTNHHTGLQLSLDALKKYLSGGVPPKKANIGLAFYVKWFKSGSGEDCNLNPIGCRAALMEDPVTGADLGKAGAFSWHDEVPSELAVSFKKALADGVYDAIGGGHYYWDEAERYFWSWDTPEAIQHKLHAVFNAHKLGGMFAWGLGEDAPDFDHLRAASEGLKYLDRNALETQHEERSEL